MPNWMMQVDKLRALLFVERDEASISLLAGFIW